MAGAKDPSEYDKLLAEVEQTLRGDATPTRGGPARRKEPALPAKPEVTGTRMPATTRALVAGAIAAAIVFVLFFVLPIPYLGEWSGAAGAFLGAAGTAFILRRR